MIKKTMVSTNRLLLCIAVASIFIGLGMLVNCSENDNPSKEAASQRADLVVYGKIFTAEGNQMVEAFAVKDGKYVYVGDKAGAEAYIENGKTEVADYTGKGLAICRSRLEPTCVLS